MLFEGLWVAGTVLAVVLVVVVACIKIIVRCARVRHHLRSAMMYELVVHLAYELKQILLLGFLYPTHYPLSSCTEMVAKALRR